MIIKLVTLNTKQLSPDVVPSNCFVLRNTTIFRPWALHTLTLGTITFSAVLLVLGKHIKLHKKICFMGSLFLCSNQAEARYSSFVYLDQYNTFHYRNWKTNKALPQLRSYDILKTEDCLFRLHFADCFMKITFCRLHFTGFILQLAYCRLHLMGWLHLADWIFQIKFWILQISKCFLQIKICKLPFADWILEAGFCSPFGIL